MNSGFIVRNSDVGGDWNMTFICPATVRNVITPIDELIFFRRVETTNQYKSWDVYHLSTGDSNFAPIVERYVAGSHSCKDT